MIKILDYNSTGRFNVPNPKTPFFAVTEPDMEHKIPPMLLTEEHLADYSSFQTRMDDNKTRSMSLPAAEKRKALTSEEFSEIRQEAMLRTKQELKNGTECSSAFLSPDEMMEFLRENPSELIRKNLEGGIHNKFMAKFEEQIKQIQLLFKQKLFKEGLINSGLYKAGVDLSEMGRRFEHIV